MFDRQFGIGLRTLTIEAGIGLAVFLSNFAVVTKESILAVAHVSTGSIHTGAIIFAWVTVAGADRMFTVAAMEITGTLASVVRVGALSKQLR